MEEVRVWGVCPSSSFKRNGTCKMPQFIFIFNIFYRETGLGNRHSLSRPCRNSGKTHPIYVKTKVLPTQWATIILNAPKQYFLNFTPAFLKTRVNRINFVWAIVHFSSFVHTPSLNYNINQKMLNGNWCGFHTAYEHSLWQDLSISTDINDIDMGIWPIF